MLSVICCFIVKNQTTISVCRYFFSFIFQSYKDNICLKSLDSNENSKATTIILTICNSHGKKFQTQYVPYAIALQQVFAKKSKKASGKNLHVLFLFLLQYLFMFRFRLQYLFMFLSYSIYLCFFFSSIFVFIEIQTMDYAN